MKLNRMKTERYREIFYMLGIGIIHKHANHCYKGRKFLNDLGCSCRLDVSRTALTEIQANGVGSEQCGVSRILDLSYTADFDARHSNPFRAAAGSEEVNRCSPIRKASAPTSSSKSISLSV